MLPCEGNWESIFRLTATRKLNKVNLVMNDGSFVLRELFHISICVTRFSPSCVEEKEALLDYVVRSDDSRQKSRKSSVFVRLYFIHSYDDSDLALKWQMPLIYFSCPGPRPRLFATTQSRRLWGLVKEQLILNYQNFSWKGKAAESFQCISNCMYDIMQIS